ncbi:hypothetical protein BpHYR1_003742 [Brachionus plicatilis]|uniref:Uncharacterized protein n=1 Tax=Brachionus plicatilis TaxID=10195 RepID=A0A3M7QU03_BRAPC|nr:hypothetical protein BpHYR1_003742 [Brachionus plicatilis]
MAEGRTATWSFKIWPAISRSVRQLAAALPASHGHWPLAPQATVSAIFFFWPGTRPLDRPPTLAKLHESEEFEEKPVQSRLSLKKIGHP